MKKILLFFFAGVACLNAFSQASDLHLKNSHSAFKIGDSSFLLNEQPFLIRCGEMHFARIPREYWQHRLRMAKAMGLNTVCAYLFWNYHEPEPDHFNWSGMADAAAFCKMAQQEGLWVIVRPGPYSCGEWEFGGFPWWLLKDSTIRLRTQHPYYLERCRKYLLEVGKQLAPLQISNGGPIIMVQVENEYGSYGSDRAYLGKLRDYLAEAGFNVPFFTCDGATQLVRAYRKDIFNVVNFSSDPKGSFEYLRKIRPGGPLMCGEYYPGWFDSWGKKHAQGSTANIIKDLEYMLNNKASFSIYMAHGGTSFGFWSGSNAPPFSPQTSSYDYDAPISEAGWDTEKYHAIRKLFSAHLQEGETLPDPPARNPIVRIKRFMTTEVAPLFSNLPSPVESVHPKNMEEYGQGYGAILYRTSLEPGPATTLAIDEVHDFALVYLDKKKIATLDRRRGQSTVTLPERKKRMDLDILVEAMGRINYGEMIHDRKGIIGSIRLTSVNSSVDLINWKIYPMPMGDLPPVGLQFRKGNTLAPAFHRATFELEETGDTFLDMHNWGKGTVWINGHCLGRFWNIGPTQTMYLPGPWLNKGKNEIIILDYLGPEKNIVAGLPHPILDDLKPEW